jgi:hypothetical protein
VLGHRQQGSQGSAKRLPRAESRPNIAGQISGFWFRPGQDVPQVEPQWLPTGALMPRLGERLAPGGVALLLVPIDRIWYPLSELGAYTYAHSEGLLRGEAWTFVPREAAGKPWPRPFVATLGERLPPNCIEAMYGPDVAERARPDALALQVRLGLPE